MTDGTALMSRRTACRSAAASAPGIPAKTPDLARSGQLQRLVSPQALSTCQPPPLVMLYSVVVFDELAGCTASRCSGERYFVSSSTWSIGPFQAYSVKLY